MKSLEISCPECGNINRNAARTCDECGDTVALKFKYDVAECQERGMTYTVPLKVTIHLEVYDKDPETGARSIRDIKEQEVYFGEIPMLTENGTFIINGTERVIVSQLHRSPGVFFQADPRQDLYMAKIIPYRGSWVEFEYDAKNLLYVRIDRKRKFLGTIFLRALGLRSDGGDPADVLPDPAGAVRRRQGPLPGRPRAGRPEGQGRGARPRRRAHRREGQEGPQADARAVREGGRVRGPGRPGRADGGPFAQDVVDPATGELLAEVNTPVADRDQGPRREERRHDRGLFPGGRSRRHDHLETLRKDTLKTPEEALVEIYRRLRPGDPPTVESSRALFEGMFFDAQRYDFSRVGRLKFNTKLGVRELPRSTARILQAEDFFRVVEQFLKLRSNPADLDDIDHLGNRRVRSVGELLENQFRIGLVRMERAIKEKMSVYQEMTTAMPHDLINAKPVMAAIQEFFGSSQLSQFMDQTNPLSEVTHKRRLSALGPGGLSRERAGFEVRDVHPTHYGRICPIETPEGPNIGLISSLSCYARINEFGFIESPYKKVENGQVIDHVRVVNPGEGSFKLGDIVRQD